MRCFGQSAAILAVGAAALMAGPRDAGATTVTWSGNNHRYDIIEVTGITWHDAYLAAKTFSAKSALVSITSAAENAFVMGLLLSTSADATWLGGVQHPLAPAPDAGWFWADGETWDYTNWALGEPNDIVPGGEFFLEMNGAGEWNDIGPSYAEKRAYVVETVPLPAGMGLLLSALGLSAFCAGPAHGGPEIG